ncbi:50S ribosomal protein L32 [Patescibacteria group bacterium]|nr:50S ribosomal protein L32 [Patescibacteria group bacterium]
MGLPGHRRTSSHKRRRASHFALKKIDLRVCSKCKKLLLPHTACKFCGSYNGRQVTKAPAVVAKKVVKAPAVPKAPKAVKAPKAKK